MPPIKLEVSDVTTTPSSDAKPKELNKCSQLELKGLESIAPLVRSVEETPEPIATEVRGTIPTWIRGNLLRNGPGKFEFGNQHYNHWFDGMAMLHQFKIEDGKVTYRSRFLQSDAYKKNSERDRIMVSEFGTVAMPDPCKNFFLRFLSRFEMIEATDNASVSFVKYKGDCFVSTETNYMYRVDPESLETQDKVDWTKFIAVNMATAHPHTEPDGTTYNMGNSYGRKAMSENYVVFIEQPIKMDLLKIVTAKLRGKGISEGVYWDPKQDTVFHLVDKHTGQTSSVKFHTKALSVFHQINAFEEDGFLMLDMCCSDNGEAINNYLIQNLRKSGEALDQVYNTTYRAFPRRFVLPLNVTDDTPTGVNLNTRPASSATSFKTAIDKVVCQFEDLHGEDLYEYGGLEFPQINYSKFNTRPYRYFYGCGFRHLVGDSLLKIDLEGKKVKVWYQKGLFPSEPVFVPSPDAVEEDDGVILSVVVTPTEDKSTFLLVLDAKTWEELGRAEVPVNIPYGFHGTFNPTT
ncbi:carotenoid-cleaving dioxygenase, mitochondrial-like isoform X2 [Salvelinus fontinalis]|uniref:carotenoid-cleaving dioxygenase, mitochondrial-like isoform X2 n=1 Tax=Salvelinus fontinalis TaxID=8038 RepID=UPI0024850DC7|nr:carotenoid-cleaving dioxygenase, mitochondrial-like isoform X2 [Salvelinus fontinalis]